MPYSTHGTGLETPRETGGNLYGRVRYGHGLTIDQPVFLWKDGNPLVPHWTFRGLAVGGSLPTSGQLATGINWPAKDRGVYFAPDTRVGVTPPSHFLGSLSDGQGSGTGLLYRRNRYFDPGSGQFTQEDPIGLAGGLNLYGYANGDPVNFSDPFGLFPCPPCAGIGQPAILSQAILEANPFVFTERKQQKMIDGLLMGATGPAGRVAAGGFASFAAFKSVAGAAGKGMHWHHIVGQTANNVERFGATAIHGADNLMAVEAGVHARISGFYSSKTAFSNGKTVREWLADQSFEAQREFGLKVLRDYGVIK